MNKIRFCTVFYPIINIALEAFTLIELIAEQSSPILHICKDGESLNNLENCLKFFQKDLNIIKIPSWDCLPYDRISPAMHVSSDRTKSLCEIQELKNDSTIILTTVNSIIQRVPSKDVLNKLIFSMKKGDRVDHNGFTRYLMQSGYINSSVAADVGEFAVRGSIIDIVIANDNKEGVGIRLDFFGNELESIGSFDLGTQTSTGDYYTDINIYPVSEVILDDNSIERFLSKYEELFKGPFSTDPLYNAISEGRRYSGMEHWIPLFYSVMCSIIDYLPSDIRISISDFVVEDSFQRIRLINKYYDSRINFNKDVHFSEESYNPIPPDKLYLTSKELESIFNNYNFIHFSSFANDDENCSNNNKLFRKNYSKVLNFVLEAKSKKKNTFEFFKSYLLELRDKYLKNKVNLKRILIACNSNGSMMRMKNILEEHEIYTSILEGWEQILSLKKDVIAITEFKLDQGFETEDFIIISEQDILGKFLGAHKPLKTKSYRGFLDKNSSFTKGEYLIHSEHGICQFQGLETLEIGDNKHDFLSLLYSNADKLYIPVENIELLTHYSNEEDVKLDKLGISLWQERKSKVKNRLKIIAEELINLAAKRSMSQAKILTPLDKVKYDEFCASFPYIETVDQLQCIEEVEGDLRSGIPMDRLICGDVGFGKTEIALRAAFISVSSGDNAQVAVICPTTLLCRQHYKTFLERFSDTGYIVKDLSRFTKRQDAVIHREGIEKGNIDIIVGTHSLFAKSIKFKNLSLIIIDEEQQFGVAQKEHFKKMRNNLHILSLSATPIPRTLQMSLSGIKDLSIIATPPEDRLAINSYVMCFDSVVLRNAIMREYYRGGKTFFIVPRIKDLDNILERLKEIVPELKITFAHGQMLSSKLNEIMNMFYDGKYDMLVATNIVGSGIDMPQANTIIIHNAHMFSLAQLYQIRGRVGRSKLRAYAYFIKPDDTILSSIAKKRLETIQTLESLGAGFTLATQDMDIRGFGNFLGDEQSGQIKEVGIELYQRMLSESIESYKMLSNTSEAVGNLKESLAPSINLGISIFIPSSYIEDVNLRMSFYSRLGNASNFDELEKIAVEIVDRFGNLPEAFENLIEVMKIKRSCILLLIEKISASSNDISIKFYNNQFEKPDLLIDFIHKNSSKLKLRGDHQLVYIGNFESPKDRIYGIKFLLGEISKILN